MSVTVRDVARAAGVSLGTVSNVLNSAQTVSAENIIKVQAAIKQLGFVRNDAARQLRAGRSRSIGLIVQDVRNPFFADLAHGAEDAAAEKNFGIFVADSDENKDREKLLLSLFEEQRALGVLVTPVEESLSHLREMKNRGTAVVVVDRKSNDRSISSVSVDDVAGGRMAVEHLIETGCHKIAFVGGPLEDRQIGERLEGAKQAAEATGEVVLEILETSNLTLLEGRRIAKEILVRPAANRPNAIFAANDVIAMAIMQELAISSEISIPEQMSIIGYDDISFAESAFVPLTTVRQPTADIGMHAVQLLIEESQSDGEAPAQQVVFQPELIIRKSTLRNVNTM